ncbi:hypothetical protein QMG61_02790 [Cryobacterium sp. PH31-AA6]|uniref:hypothetical protein n=1 Tax=Cryobacterium sp. PH31-AA6 TaxID=3046205 RepID=UPI0024B9A308|nr:hypothetical protein [Cryobacterium sp. PH31-AA6]MDJ0322690.1 hypothetical protein [Cryobacterium sp. PH31-AA6]
MARPNILDRFRPAGAPGAAGPAGVPSSDRLGPAAELAAVFAALATDVESCQGLVQAARLASESELSHARESADALIAQARLDAGAEQSRAAARVLDAASETDTQLLERADGEAAELRETGTARMPAAVRQVIDTLLAEQLTRP